MRKTFKYRLYLTPAQETILLKTLDECRWLYNHLLEQRKTAWEQDGRSLTLYEQQGDLPTLKRERPRLKMAYSQVLQNVAVRIDLAFQAFFRRAKAGETPGFPRFRGKGRYTSLTYPQLANGCVRLKDDVLHVAHVGGLKIVSHRPLEGTPKTATISVSSTGKWYVCFSCECADPTPLPMTGQEVGIDVGLTTFATLSTGEQIANPRFFRADEKALGKAQKRLSKADKGTPERKKRRKPVSRVYERIAWRRTNFAHQHSRRIVTQHDLIAVEDLSINRMIHNHCLAKSIADAAWRQFASLLSYKAAWAGRKYVAVNPAYTSQDCSACGHRQKMPLSERTYTCPCCGLVRDRDLNASLNILRLGRQSQAAALP
ncbi:MAG TPA: RNA-guided endonuclease TnpB family protein [Ktedonobacterales bacterium]|nr:RNA-guided endonuclease TnpB family protein [Ktedonobacterales bacterium]